MPLIVHSRSHLAVSPDTRAYTPMLRSSQPLKKSIASAAIGSGCTHSSDDSQKGFAARSALVGYGFVPFAVQPGVLLRSGFLRGEEDAKADADTY